MVDAEIKFEREGREGIVAVGTYLIDALKRLGIGVEGTCSPGKGIHFCAVNVISGAENLSEMTEAETEHFAGSSTDNTERLACQAFVVRAGEIEVMTKEKKEEASKTDEASVDYKEKFAELPLEKKIASLVQLEAITLGETFSFILNSPLKIVEKLGDVMAEFGMKLEKEAKDAGRPPEHRASAGSSEDETQAKPKPAGRSARRKPQKN